jgi:hypothetical protein
MATDRQIEANRRNAERSTGPKSELGKSQSRRNSTKHGLAGESAELEATLSPEFQERRAKWAAEQNPVGEEGHWALDRVVAATFRIERCEGTIDRITTDIQQRASLAWEQDQAVEAAQVAARLTKDPVLASRQLQTTLAGVGLLIEAWLGLATALQTAGEWSELEASIALDLLGASPDLRSGQTLIDAPKGADLLNYRKELAFEELERLGQLRDEAMVPLDEFERRRAMAGHSALLSKPAKLVLRYERDAWKRYRDAMKELKAQAQAPASPPVAVAVAVAVAPTRTPIVVEPPRVREQAVAPKVSSFEDERRALLAEAAPFVKQATDRLIAMGLTDEDAWLEQLEREVEAGFGQFSVTERTQFGGVPVGQGS